MKRPSGNSWTCPKRTTVYIRCSLNKIKSHLSGAQSSIKWFSDSKNTQKYTTGSDVRVHVDGKSSFGKVGRLDASPKLHSNKSFDKFDFQYCYEVVGSPENIFLGTDAGQGFIVVG